MYAIKLPSGNLQVPCRVEGPGGIIGDAVKEITPTDPEYQRWLRWLKPDEPVKKPERIEAKRTS